MAKKEKVKKENTVVKSFKMYNFIFKLVAFALLIVLGVLMIIYDEQAVGAIYLITGIVVAFSALFRIIPLIKTLKTKRAKLINFIEILAHIVIGAYLIFAACYHWGLEVPVEGEEIEQLNDALSQFNLTAYRYIVIAVFFSRGIIYYWTSILYNEATNKVNFWLHTILISLALAFAFIEFTPKDIVIAIIVLVFICAVVIGGEAGFGYGRYRKQLSKSKQEEKEKPVTEEVPVEAPQDETNKEKEINEVPKEEVNINEIDPSIIPVEDGIQDSNIVS